MGKYEITLRQYGDSEFFQEGWHFVIQAGTRKDCNGFQAGIYKYYKGFHATNPIKAILNVHALDPNL